MKIQTLSVVCGTRACNANCPFCVSQMTPSVDLKPEVNWRNFKRACRLAQIGGATTVLLTGKGEPTLYPKLILDYLTALNPWQFPFIELQTNGIRFGLFEEKCDYTEDGQTYVQWLRDWYNAGLTTICLSAVHYDWKKNKEIYGKEYQPLSGIVNLLHHIGYTVRFSIMMMKDYIDNPDEVEKVIKFCKGQKIKQLTIRPITTPENVDNPISKWTEEHALESEELTDIQEWLIDLATPVLTLSHGATVYDYEGQNVCLANCLTTNKTDDDIRQIIYYPDGTVSYDWKYKGAVLL